MDLRERVRAAVLSVPDVVESPGIFDEGMALWVNTRQMANFVGDDTLALRLTRPLMREHRERLRHDDRIVNMRASSDWLGVRFTSVDDIAFIRELVELAAATCRPSDGSPSRPPPTGEDLERRRRFH
jgi:hypothetical protein